MVAGLVHGHAGGVDGFDGAHAVALNAGDLDEAADGVAGHAEVVLHGDLGGVFDLGVGAVEGRDQASRGHAAGYADFALAADFCAGDAGVLFVEDADGCGGEEVADEAGFFFFGGFVFRSSFCFVFGEAHVVVGDGGDDSGGSVGRGGDDSASGGVFFVDGHGVDGDPVERGEGVFGAFGLEAVREAWCSAADVEASGEDAFGGDASCGAGLHGLPEGEDAGFNLGFGSEGRRMHLRG